MSHTRTQEERARSRAEARRRSRQAARGELLEDEEPRAADEPPARQGGFLQRLFPPAPPLPNRPDPLAGFDRRGPVRPVREWIFLLRRNPLAWTLPALACFIGYYFSLVQSGNFLGVIGTFVMFGSIIAAGWIGWQRPALFGTVTAIIGFVLVWTAVTLVFTAEGADPTTFGTPLELAASFGVQALLQAALGFLGGWYGGYLRRRQTQLSAETQRARGTRRRR